MQQFEIVSPKYGNKIVLVDDEDYERVSQFKWSAQHDTKGKLRAVTRQAFVGLTIFLHRFILELDREDRRIVDHINRDPLDNRRSNLRITSRSINYYNSERSDNSSYIKVVPHGFVVRASLNKRVVHLGTFKTREEAAEVAQRYRESRFTNATTP
jgi:hypothetical protein